MHWDRTVTTIYLDGQFWVALIERCTASGQVAARHVFGPEPNNAELLDWPGGSWRRLRFVSGLEPPPYDGRRRREAGRTGKLPG